MPAACTDSPTITGASSFAAMPLLHALLRRQPQRLLLCDELDAIADLQPQLLPWCEQQGIKTDLQWCCLEPLAALPELPARQWLIHANNVRAEELLQTNSAAAVRRNIVATQQLLAALPAGGVPLVLLSSHLAGQRQGVAGSTLAAAEALVAHWAACHPHCAVQVWRLPPAFDPKPSAPDPASAWLRERLAEQFIDQLMSSPADGEGQQLIAADPAPSCDQLLSSQPLSNAVTLPAQSIDSWLASASVAEPLARYDNQAMLAALGELWA
jgi:nucleoside-diphosphate-sugar epimerase